jgi:hypothetical protein
MTKVAATPQRLLGVYPRHRTQEQSRWDRLAFVTETVQRNAGSITPISRE